MIDVESLRTRRLTNQRIVGSGLHKPAEIVAALGAVQAQDYPAALWAIGLRTGGAVQADVERAIADGAIVRTYPLRGTLHFVAAADVRWMLHHLGPRIVAGAAAMHRKLGIDDALVEKSAALTARALEGGRRLTRDALNRVLEEGGIVTSLQRGYHLRWRMALDGLICLGPHQGVQPTYVLLDEWVPPSLTPPRDTALAMLASRYFSSHGPATVQDFAWWSGLTLTEACTTLASIAPSLTMATIDGTPYFDGPSADPTPTPESPHVVLLPGFDEYVLGYTNRDAVLKTVHARKAVAGANGIFAPTLAVDGIVRGTWKRAANGPRRGITAAPFDPLSPAAERAVAEATERYQRFVDNAPSPG